MDININEIHQAKIHMVQKWPKETRGSGSWFDSSWNPLMWWFLTWSLMRRETEQITSLFDNPNSSFCQTRCVLRRCEKSISLDISTIERIIFVTSEIDGQGLTVRVWLCVSLVTKIIQPSFYRLRSTWFFAYMLKTLRPTKWTVRIIK